MIGPFQLRKIHVLTWNVLNGRIVRFPKRQGIARIGQSAQSLRCLWHSIPAGGKKSVNAVWSYQEPFPAVKQIKGHVAFYPDRVDEIAEQLAR